MKKCKLLVLSFLIFSTGHGQSTQGNYNINIVNGDLFIEVFVNNKGPYNFIFDTGATGIGRIDSRVAKELNLNVVDSIRNYDGSGNYNTEPMMGIKELSVGGITLQDIKLMSRNYNRNYKDGDIRTDGIIGRDFFKDYFLVLDCPNGLLTISKSSLDSTDTNVIKYSEAFKVSGKIGDLDTLFHIDTGSNIDFHIPKSIMDNMNYLDTKTKRIARKANSEFLIQEAILFNKLIIGGVEVEDHTVNYSENASYINVGMKFIKNYKISLDQKNKLFKIE